MNESTLRDCFLGKATPNDVAKDVANALKQADPPPDTASRSPAVANRKEEAAVNDSGQFFRVVGARARHGARGLKPQGSGLTGSDAVAFPGA